VGGLWVSVIGVIGAESYFFQFIRGGGVEEVADAFLALMFDGMSRPYFKHIADKRRVKKLERHHEHKRESEQ
jgi:hypothetical protein